MRKHTQRQIAAEVGVSQQTVSYVLRRDGVRYEDELAQRNALIRSAREQGCTASQLADQFGLSVRQIRRIWGG